MGRVMAFDFGTRRVGVAVTDPLRLIANSLETLPTTQIFPFIKKYCTAETVDEFVVGYPYAHGHSHNPVTEHIDAFIAQLQKEFPSKKIHKVDESFTSRIASQTLLQSGIGKKERRNKAHLDAISANIILQAFLEMKG